MTMLTDQTVLVTGANRGIGAEFVAQLLGRDVAKVYAAARDADSVDAAARDADSVDASDPRVVPLRLDVTDPESVARVASTAKDVSIVVNNAGIALAAPLHSPDPASLRQEMEVNFFGPVAVAAAFADRVAERSGAIVNVASALSWFALGGSYSASKAALWSATDSLRLELAPRGVQVLGVHMGYVDTDMASGVEAPKASPGDIVRQVLDGLESGVDEVLADDTARSVRSGLHLPVGERYATFLPQSA